MRTVNGVTLQPDAWQAYATQAVVVTPSDTVPLIDQTRFVYVGGTGNLTVIPAGSPTEAPVTFSNVPVGTLLPIAIIQVMATGTTASAIVAMI